MKKDSTFLIYTLREDWIDFDKLRLDGLSSNSNAIRLLEENPNIKYKENMNM